MMMRKSVSVLAMAAWLSACTMIPEVSTPEFSAAGTWGNIPGYDTPAGTATVSSMRWQDFFATPQLQSVIQTALDNNKDLKIAALNIEEARALYRIERADLTPTLNAAGQGTITKSTDESSITGNGQRTEAYEANLGIAAYELDLFGKIRSNNESALNSYLATQEAHAVVRNALIAEVANAYLQLLTDQKLLSLTKQTLAAQQKTYGLLSKTLELGAATEQDVARAETAVETAKVNMHQYSRLVAQDKNALFLLMGVAQDDTLIPSADLDVMHLNSAIDPGLPSAVLLMRPDIRQAEYELISANANIGAARAAFFPNISLTGSFGFASQDLGNLFNSGAAGAWSFIPQITMPIFEGGRNVANLDLAEVRKEKAIVNYEQAIQIAFREVSDELAARATVGQQLEAQRRLVAAGGNVYDKTSARYHAGIDSFLSVLDAQRELYAYQQNEILTQQLYLSNLVNLYKVLGGQ